MGTAVDRLAQASLAIAALIQEESERSWAQRVLFIAVIPCSKPEVCESRS